MSNPTLMTLLPWCFGAFFSGSIPFGLLVVRLAGKGDIRNTGSGNIGATNVMRSGGKALGILTLLLDVAKGFLPVFLAKIQGLPSHLLSFVALAAVLGHVFTPWLRFKGGKGVATALGVALAYHPMMVLPAFASFLILVLVFRYISLGSIVAALVLIPAATGLLGSRFCPLATEYSVYPLISWVLVSLLVVGRHSANIQRLIAGTESRFWGGQKGPKHV